VFDVVVSLFARFSITDTFFKPFAEMLCLKSDNLTVVAVVVVADADAVAAVADYDAGVVVYDVVDGLDLAHTCLVLHKLPKALTVGLHWDLPFEPYVPCMETLLCGQMLVAFVAFVHCSNWLNQYCYWDLCLNDVNHCAEKHYTCCD
jgi:hypothetical protein